MGNKEFSLGHDVFAVSIRQLSGDVVWATVWSSGRDCRYDLGESSEYISYFMP